MSYLFDCLNPHDLIVEAQYQFENNISFWEHIQMLASFAIPTIPTQEFVVESDIHLIFFWMPEDPIVGFL